MNGIRLETLMAAHTALMRAWRAGPSPSHDTRVACLDAASVLIVELRQLGLTVEVKTEPEKVAA